MKVREFGEAIDRAVAAAMAADERIVVFGEGVPMIRRELLVRFGPNRVFDAPISESAFLGAAVGAALGGLIPIVEIMLVDFLGVALSALLNEAAKIEAFSGGSWRVPMVVRATCGGGYGDGGQHEQALWGLLGGIAGLTVVVPSTPADAAGLMVSAVANGGPVVFLEHKLLSQVWLEAMGGAGRPRVGFDVPAAGAHGEVADPPAAVPIGRAGLVRSGDDIMIVSVGVGVHRALEAAGQLAHDGIEAAVVDLRTIVPLDRATIHTQARSTGRVLVVDEDYVGFGLTGEVAAVIAEAGIPVRFGRVATERIIPYARHLEEETLPSVERILLAARRLLA
jgi:pyruvate dehydrogenase E1 component beta subunit